MLSLLVVALLSTDAGLKLDAGTKTDAGVRDAGQPGPVVQVLPTKLPDGGSLAPCRETPQICFSPDGNCDLLVVRFIDRTQAGEALDISIYAFNRPSIIDAVLRVKAKGAVVRLILDTSQIGDPKEQLQLRRLVAVGVPMKRDTHQGSMHNKVVIRAGQEVLTGSLNFTNNASESNNENVLAWDCQKVALVYKAQFDALWVKFKDATELVMRDGG